MIKNENASLEEKVYEELQHAILQSELKNGESLTELSLCKKLDVSRTPVRGALHRLAEEGLVDVIPNRGAVVIGVTESDLVDIYHIRMRLEGLASAMAARNMTDEEKKSLADNVDLTEFYMTKNDVEKAKELDTTFHKTIYRASGSRILEKILTELHRNITYYRKNSLLVPGRIQKSVEEHREILNAILAGDADAADKLTHRHIEHALVNLLKSMKIENQ